MMNYTDESKKVDKKGGDKFWAVYRRIAVAAHTKTA